MENNWIELLKLGFKGDVMHDEETLKTFSRDASIFEVKPQVVVFPSDESDLKFLVKFVNDRKGLTLTARSAGTDMTGGPLSESIVVSFTKYINKLVKLDKIQATVEPGLYYRDLEAEMNKISVMYPSYPASKSLCAFGGIIANNSGGEKSLIYGQTVDHVKRLKVVLSDGNSYEFKPLDKKQLGMKMRQRDFEGKLYRDVYNLIEENYDIIRAARPTVSKNSCGYFLWRVWDKKTFDMSKLFVGSQGTLGMWYEADVNLVRKYPHSRLVVVSLDNLNQISELVETVKKYNPESLESFDKHTLMLGLKFMPEIAKKVNKNIISFLWGFRREAIGVLFHGFSIFTILIELTGDDEAEIQKRANELGEVLKKEKIRNLVMKSEGEGEKYWVMRRESFNLLRQKVKGKMATPFVDDFSVRPEQLSEFLPKLYSLLESYKITPTLAGHVGDGNFHIIPLMDLKLESEKEKIPIVLGKFADLVKQYGGTLTAEHNDGLIRTPFLESQYGGKVIKLFEDVKDIFDPKNIFNPGKKVHGDIKFATEHIKAK